MRSARAGPGASAGAREAASERSRAAEAYDGFAAEYDEWVGEHVSARRAKAALLSRARGLTRPGERALDVGCGTGSEAIALARAGRVVLGIDPAPRMLALARGKAERAGVDVRFAEGLASAPDPAWGSGFDLVYSAYGVVNLEPDVASTLGALAGLVRPGGHLLIGTLNPTALFELTLWPLALHAKGFRKAAAPRVELRLGHGRRESATCVLPSNAVLARHGAAVGLDLVEEVGLHVLAPPPNEWLVARFPRFVAAVNRIERGVESRRPFSRLGYFSLLTFRKVDA